MTRNGWFVTGAGVVLLVTGRLLGLPDLYIFGAVLECLVLACVAWALATRPRLSISRRVRPSRVNVGSNSRVELSITNSGTRRSPVMAIRDPVSGTPGAEILLAPLAPGEQVGSAYHLPTTSRGLLSVGPLEVAGMDPFGLTRFSRQGSELVEVTVLPHVERLAPPPVSSGDDPHGRSLRARRAGRSGEEFHGLRPYVVGDDLRRVHWASTARSGDLMVRHDETPWQGRTTVLVDLRADGDLLEQAVSAAASVLVAGWRRGDLVRLLTSGGSDSGFGTGQAHLDAAMEHLAVADTTAAGDLGAVAHLLDRGSAGALVALLTTPSAADLGAVTASRAAVGSVIVVAFDSHSPSVVGPGDPVRPRVITVGPDRTFADVWNQAAVPGLRPGRTTSSAPAPRALS